MRHKQTAYVCINSKDGSKSERLALMSLFSCVNHKTEKEMQGATYGSTNQTCWEFKVRRGSSSSSCDLSFVFPHLFLLLISERTRATGERNRWYKGTLVSQTQEQDAEHEWIWYQGFGSSLFLPTTHTEKVLQRVTRKTSITFPICLNDWLRGSVWFVRQFCRFSSLVSSQGFISLARESLNDERKKMSATYRCYFHSWQLEWSHRSQETILSLALWSQLLLVSSELHTKRWINTSASDPLCPNPAETKTDEPVLTPDSYRHWCPYCVLFGPVKVVLMLHTIIPS